MDIDKDNKDIQNVEEEIPEVTVTFKLTEKDLYKALINMFRKSSIIGVVFASLIISAMVCRFIDNFWPIPTGFYTLIIFFGIAALIFVLFNYLFKLQAHNSYKNDKEMQSIIKHKIYRNKIITETDMGFSVRKFSDMYKFVDTKENLLLYLAGNKAVIFPKRYFSSKEDLDKTKELFSKISMPKIERTINVFSKIGLILIVIPIVVFIIALIVLFFLR